MDSHHIVVDYQSPFGNGSFINNPSPTEVSDGSNELRPQVQIPTLITKINRRRSRRSMKLPKEESSEREIQKE